MWSRYSLARMKPTKGPRKGFNKKEREDNELIHEAMRLLRVYSDKSQGDMAKEIGFVNSWVSELEKGKKNITEEFVRKYAKIFNVTPEFIILFAQKLQKNKKLKKEIFDAVVQRIAHED